LGVTFVAGVLGVGAATAAPVAAEETARTPAAIRTRAFTGAQRYHDHAGVSPSFRPHASLVHPGATRRLKRYSIDTKPPHGIARSTSSPLLPTRMVWVPHGTA